MGLLVTIHELGHFWVACICGVHVKKFAVGFGRELFTLRSKRDTEYSIRLIPLGGFVSMLSKKDLLAGDSRILNTIESKTIAARMAIVVAGPAINLMLGFVLIWALMLNGTTGIVPIVSSITDGSIAQKFNIQPGSTITSINGEKTKSIASVNFELAKAVGENRPISIGVFEKTSQNYKVFVVPTGKWLNESGDGEALAVLGIDTSIPLPAEIGTIEADSPAERSGLLAGDVIKTIRGIEIRQWSEIGRALAGHYSDAITVVVMRKGDMHSVVVQLPAKSESDDKSPPKLGIQIAEMPIPANYLLVTKYGFLAAGFEAVKRTVDTSKFIFTGVAKLVKGSVSTANVGGTISIAKSSGEAWQEGLATFTAFIALMSINLCVLNLLPIPVLDGGALLLLTIEGLTGITPGEKLQAVLFAMGVSVVGTVLVLGTINDIKGLF